jgi:hypothetical protein
MVKCEQLFERPLIRDIDQELINKLYQKKALSNIKKDQNIAITVGSRGIENLPFIIKTLIREIKKIGARPFLVPAMGSHGGATAEGQKSMLEGMGFSEEYVGVPIKSSMEVVQIGTSANNLPVYMDKFAYNADSTIIINRIKPHVSFRGDYESGLIKMITIGLGKQKGADVCHNLGFGMMAENIVDIARVTLEKSNIIFGIGILENAYHETCKIETLRTDEIENREPYLQKEAKRLAPKLYFDKFDVLIIDEIGKDISGTGFDTNLVGRYNNKFISGGPDITRVAVLDLTEKSHGNGNGIGLVDFTTKRFFEKMIFEQTYPNSLTSTVPSSVKIPMVLKSDKQVIQACIKTSNILNREKVKMVRIKNTVEMGEIEITCNLLDVVRTNEKLNILSEPYFLKFNGKDNLF